MMAEHLTAVEDMESTLSLSKKLLLEDGQDRLCFICDNITNDESVKLQFGQTVHSKTGLPIKLGQLIGDDFMVIVSVDDRLCFGCIKLINLADKLEIKLNFVKKVITEHLKSKYQLSDDVNSYTAVSKADVINSSLDYESEPESIITDAKVFNESNKTDLFLEKTGLLNNECDSDIEIVEDIPKKSSENIRDRLTNDSSLADTEYSSLKNQPFSSPLVNKEIKPKKSCNIKITANKNNLNVVDSVNNSNSFNKPTRSTSIKVKKEIVLNKVNRSRLKPNDSSVNRSMFQCTMCCEEYQTQVLLRQHIMGSHLTKWSCHFCSTTFNNCDDYQKHMKTHIKNVTIDSHTSDNAAIYNDCSGNFSSGGDVLKLEKQSEIKPFFKCKNCKFKTKFNYLLEKHENECCFVDNKYKFFKCSTCFNLFKTKKLLNAHICSSTAKDVNCSNSLENNDGEKSNVKSSYFQCGICSLTFNDKDNLVQHLRNHKGSKPCKNKILNYSLRGDQAMEIIPVDVDLNTSETNCDLKQIETNVDDQFLNSESIHCNHCLLTFDKQLSYDEHLNDCKNNKINESDKKVIVQSSNDMTHEIYFDNVEHFMALSADSHTLNKSKKECSLNVDTINNENCGDKKSGPNLIHMNQFICDTCSLSFDSKNELDKHIVLYDHKFKQNLDFKFSLMNSENNFDNKDFVKEDKVVDSDKNSDMELHFVEGININSQASDDENNSCNREKNFRFIDDFTCSLCPYVTSSTNELRSHQLLVHNLTNEMVKCNICDKLFCKADENEHYNSHKTIQCKYCSFETKNRKLMIKHIKEHNNKNNCRKEKLDYLCQYCSETFKTKKSLKSHEDLHPENFEFNCDKCSKKFVKEKQLKNHYDEVHRDPHCYYCGKEILNLKALKNHEQRHIRDLHNSSKLECNMCKRVFKTRTGLRHHFAVHTGKFKYFCDFCQRGFMSRMMLEEHRSRHTKEDRYVCDVCGRKFTFQSTYWIHRKWHDNPFPYKCNYCGRLFRHTSLLAVHKRKHTGERPYKCPHCPSSFTVGGTLKRHLILHTQKFPFWCETCKRGFTTKHKYSVHLSKMHNNDELLNDRKSSKKQTEFKMVIKEKLSVLNSDSINKKISATREQSDNFEFISDSTNFTLVNMEEDDAGNSAIMLPCIMTSVTNEENSGLVFEIISSSPLQQISNSITLPENTVLPDMWCQ